MQVLSYQKDPQRYVVGAETYTKLIAPSTGASEMVAWHHMAQPGACGPLHHHDHEQIIIMLKGTCTVLMGDNELSLAGGDAYVVPRYVPHELVNRTREPWELITVMPVGTRIIRPDGGELSARWAK